MRVFDFCFGRYRYSFLYAVLTRSLLRRDHPLRRGIRNGFSCWPVSLDGPNIPRWRGWRAAPGGGQDKTQCNDLCVTNVKTKKE